jgi:hypothetical protein
MLSTTSTGSWSTRPSASSHDGDLVVTQWHTGTVTGIDLSYEQPYGIRPVQRAVTSDSLTDEQAARVRAAAAAASAKAAKRLTELRAVTAPRTPRVRRAA